jgi:hydrogenase maturation protein HypF
VIAARRIHVRGVVQGVGFRPYVFRLARTHGLCGWVRNGDDGVRVHVEGSSQAIDAFVTDLVAHPPPAAIVESIDTVSGEVAGCSSFDILDSTSSQPPTTRIAPDMPVCPACLAELFDGGDRRHGYPYINCTNCGPRFSIVYGLPYDRPQTTMANWPLCEACAAEYSNPADRRFHAQPVACPACGPGYRLVRPGAEGVRGWNALEQAALLLLAGRIVAVKGIGGYHLACDADNRAAVATLRQRKYRKERAFALMVRDLAIAERTIHLTDAVLDLLLCAARPIVLAPAVEEIPGVAPDNDDLGVMLPYAPLHYLLFDAGAPDRLVMTSGNMSNEPIAFEDADALTRLRGIADAWLVGERAIARRVDDSVIRHGSLGPIVLRRSRGLAPGAVAALPSHRPILALGADLKNAITLVVDGQAYVSQHIGDLANYAAFEAFERAIDDLVAMYDLSLADLVIAHDAHPQYASTMHASGLQGCRTIAIQHHRSHIASVLAERGEFDRRVVGIAFDGTGYGDDGAIWGGEFFVGSVAEGFDRVAHLRPARLPGGDAAARYPVQAAAGFLYQLDGVGDVTAPPFDFPGRYTQAAGLLQQNLRTFETTSVGRLFDTVAALVGFTRPITFEGQAAMWLEHLARRGDAGSLALPCRFADGEVDWRETLGAIVRARRHGESAETIARAFHQALARATADAAADLCARFDTTIVVVSGGVMQNDLFLAHLRDALFEHPLRLWTNRNVPPNDGGVSLGQAALAACAVEKCSPPA